MAVGRAKVKPYGAAETTLWCGVWGEASMEKQTVFTNRRYGLVLRVGAGDLARFDDYRDQLLTTIGLHPGDKAAFACVQWVHTADPPAFDTDDDAWMAAYYKKKYGIHGHGHTVSEVGFLFRGADDTDSVFYVLDRDLPELAAYGFVHDTGGAALDAHEAVGVAMRLYADMKNELTDQPWCVCPSSRARTRFLPTVH